MKLGDGLRSGDFLQRGERRPLTGGKLRDHFGSYRDILFCSILILLGFTKAVLSLKTKKTLLN